MIKKFAIIALNLKKKTYVIHIAIFVCSNKHIYLFRLAKIKGLLFADVFMTVHNKYKNFADIFP